MFGNQENFNRFISDNQQARSGVLIELIEENMFLKNLEIAHDSYLKTMKKGGKTNIFSRKFAFMPEEDRPKTRPVVWYAAAAAATHHPQIPATEKGEATLAAVTASTGGFAFTLQC